MKKLNKQIHRFGISLAVAVGLTILAAVATPLLGDELANIFGPAKALAGETSGGGG